MHIKLKAIFQKKASVQQHNKTTRSEAGEEVKAVWHYRETTVLSGNSQKKSHLLLIYFKLNQQRINVAKNYQKHVISREKVGCSEILTKANMFQLQIYVIPIEFIIYQMTN